MCGLSVKAQANFDTFVNLCYISKRGNMTTFNYKWFARDGEEFVIRFGTVDAFDVEDAERRVMEIYENDYFWGGVYQEVEVWVDGE